jgi:hypothetical protein
MKAKTISGRAPGPPRMAGKPAGNGGSPKNGQVKAGMSQVKHGTSDAPSPPKPKVGKGGNGQFTPPKGRY